MRTERLKREFRNPGAEYSMFPFWFLNDRLSREKLAAQLDDFQAKGIDGFVLHPRMGLPEDLEYFGEAYFSLVRFLLEEAERRGMHAVLYDEGMYPSGSAHGMVVRANPAYAARALRKETVPAGSPFPPLGKGERAEASFLCAGDGDETRPLSVVRPLLPGEKTDARSGFRAVRLISTFSRGTIRGVHFGEDDGEPNAPAAADLLNPDSVKKFIELTYDRYAREAGRFFGGTVIALFTDEPSLLGRCVDERRLKPWTPGFLNFYQSVGGTAEDLLALWYDTGPEAAAQRARFGEALSLRLEQTYYRQLSEWCEAHGIALTGHPAKSWDIGAERWFQTPGQDIVWRCVEPGGERGVTGPDSVVGKCSADAARHFGRRRNGNECFGCCGPDGRQWEFSASDMKWYMDWLFARGVNLLYPHAFFYSIRGSRRDERAPDVGPHNLWWPYFSVFSGYAKRMCWLNTDSVNTARVAVLCGKSVMPWRCAKILQQNQIELNYLEQGLLTEACSLNGPRITIRNQSYSAVVAENADFLSPGSAAFLARFAANGGLVVSCGTRPELLPRTAVRIGAPERIAEALAGTVPPDVLAADAPGLRVSRLKKGGCDFFLLVNEGEETIDREAGLLTDGNLEAWDAMTGSVSPLPVTDRREGRVFFRLFLPRRETLILRAGGDAEPRPVPPAPVPLGETRVDAGFTLRFADGEVVPLSGLLSWTELPGRADFSGTGIYGISCSVPVPEGTRTVLLDCGDVRDLAELWVNGRRIGVRLWAPYRFDVTRQAGTRIESIRIAVTNSIANRNAGARLASGLLGPVTLRFFR